MAFGIVDIVVIAVIAVSLIIGLIRGFAKTVFSLGKRLLGLIIDLFLCAPIARICVKFGFVQNMNARLVASLQESNAIFAQEITQESIDGLADTLPAKFKILTTTLQKVLNSALGELKDTGITLGQAVGDTITYYIVLVVVFIILLIILTILLTLLFKLFKNMIESMTLVNVLDKILGLVLGTILGILFIGLAFIVLDFLSTLIGGVQTFMENYIVVSVEPEKFSVTRFIYLNNPVRLLFNLLVRKENIDWSTIQLS